MKILIIAIISITCSAAHFTGSNLSLIETKVIGGQPFTNIMNFPFMAAIIRKEPSWKTIAMGSFYDQNNVITTKLVACQIEKKKDKYFVLTSIAGDNSELSIDSVYYDCNYEFGILKLNSPADRIPDDVINFNPIEYITPTINDRVFYSGGLGLDNENGQIFKYLKINLLDSEYCNYWILNYFSAMIGRTIVCGIPQDGYFENKDIGAPLYMNEHNLIGIAITKPIVPNQITLFSVLYENNEDIGKFAEKPLSNVVQELPNRLRSLRLHDTEGPGSSSSNMNSGNLRQREARTTGSFLRMMRNTMRDESESSSRHRRPSGISKERMKEIFRKS